jgi:predicted CoA-binding protein
MNVKDGQIQALMSKYKKFCVYGLSPDTSKPSHYVPVYMREQGWDMVGIYPKAHSEGGFKIYQTLAEVPAEYRRFLDVFQSPKRIPAVVDEVLELGGVEVLWLQLGITHHEAEVRAEKAGLQVVSDRCLIPEHKRWFKA